MEPEGARRRTRHRTVDRIAAIMECAARSRSGVTLSELAAALDAPVSSTQGLVNGLVAVGYLDEDARRYSLGSAPYLLNRLAGRRPVASVTRADLDAVHERTGLTTVLSIAVGGDLFYVEHSAADPQFAYLAENHVRRSLIRASSGWVLLAGMERRDLWAYLQDVPAADGPLVDAFLAALPEIAATGVCAAPQASDVADGASIAVREHGRTVAAVGIIASAAEIGARRDELVAVLGEAAAAWAARST